MREVSLKGICKIIIRFGWLISLIAFVAMTIAACYFFLVAEDEFTSSTTLYVLNRQEEESVSSSDLTSSLSLVADYREIITSRTVTNTVSELLGMEDLKEYTIAVQAASDTRIIEISVTGPRAYVAANVANGLREVFSDLVIDIMQVDNVSMIDPAEVSKVPSGPARETNIIVTTIVSALAMAVILVMAQVMSTTLKTAADIEEQIKLPVLAEIPMFVDKRTLKRNKQIRKKGGTVN